MSRLGVFLYYPDRGWEWYNIQDGHFNWSDYPGWTKFRLVWDNVGALIFGEEGYR